MTERNHVQHPSPTGRRPPDHLLRDLRQVDETLDCHYLGEGRWAVGAVSPNKERRRMARNKLDGYAKHGVDDPSKATMALLALKGFSPIALYRQNPHQAATLWGRIVHDIRKRDWLYRHRGDEEFEAGLSVASRSMHDTGPTLDDIEDAIHQEYPYLFRGRTHPYVGV